MAQLLFEELSKRVYKGSDPIYNLLPDILSTLSSDASLPTKQFRAIMAFLLRYIQVNPHTLLLQVAEFIGNTGVGLSLSAVNTYPGFVRCAALALFHTPMRAVRRAGMVARNGSDADVIYYLNMTNYLYQYLVIQSPALRTH